METKKKLRGAEAFGVKVIVSKSFGKKVSGKVLFPKKLKKANSILAELYSGKTSK
jgi:hypothetical protein